MTIREILAKNSALKAEAETMWNAAANGNGFTPEQKDRYEAIKTQIAANAELVSAAAEIAQMNPAQAAVNVPDNATEVRASKEYELAFRQYVMTRGRQMPEILAANVSTGDFASDGVLLPTTFDKAVIELANGDSIMRQLATVIPTTMDVPFVVEKTRGDAAATAEAPGTAGSNNYHQDDPTFDLKKLSAFKITKTIPISEELFADYNAFSAYVTGNLGRSIADQEEKWFVAGAGTTEPEGVLTGASAGVTLTSTSAIDYVEDLQDLIGSLKSAYLNGACFLMNRATKTYLRKLTNASTGLPLWPSNEQTLHGFPVYLSDAMPTIAAGKVPVLFGNFKQAVLIGDRGNLQTRILDQVSAKVGMVDFIGKRRVDQIVILPEAVKKLTMAAA